jgi:hypothetical protein
VVDEVRHCSRVLGHGIKAIGCQRVRVHVDVLVRGDGQYYYLIPQLQILHSFFFDTRSNSSMKNFKDGISDCFTWLKNSRNEVSFQHMINSMGLESLIMRR